VLVCALPREPTTVEIEWWMIEDPQTFKWRRIEGMIEVNKEYQKFDRTRYRETWRNRPATILYLHVDFWPAGKKVLPKWWAHGPMSPSGKRHGEWTFFFHGDDDTPPRLMASWYWYGEQISEGDWHLRNRN